MGLWGARGARGVGEGGASLGRQRLGVAGWGVLKLGGAQRGAPRVLCVLEQHLVVILRLHCLEFRKDAGWGPGEGGGAAGGGGASRPERRDLAESGPVSLRPELAEKSGPSVCKCGWLQPGAGAAVGGKTRRHPAPQH